MTLNILRSWAVTASATLLTALTAGCAVTVTPPQSGSNFVPADPPTAASIGSPESNSAAAEPSSLASANSQEVAARSRVSDNPSLDRPAAGGAVANPITASATTQFVSGTYCYEADARPNDGPVLAALELNVKADGSVLGLQADGQVERPEDADIQTFAGVIEGPQLLIHLWNIFNHGENPIVWQANPARIDTGYLTYSAVNCDAIAFRFMGP
ncbi:hypothetical protein QQ056_13425 [Oscillatoria laete-virens NRMC-F 0139]|nr:hypothetical protein [Oscillatoria laete-virens]MDL5054540.1 hypothetical protein [Oscillatoria laete-virens NRMC-F 0139]